MSLWQHGSGPSGHLIFGGGTGFATRIGQAFLKAPHELLEGNTDGLAVAAKLNEVEAAFSAFVVTDAGARRVEALGKGGLREAGIRMGAAQEVLEVLLLGAVNAFSHSPIICVIMPLSEVQTEAGCLPAEGGYSC